jgi:hypothetical protein
MTATRALPEVNDVVVDEKEALRERRLGGALLALTFLYALVFQSLFFEWSNTMGGDLDYHRGVAFTMSAGNWQGEGPVDGLISYFGGLFPFVLGWGSRLLDVSFDALLSVVSWPFALVLPLTLLWLGRRLWPNTWLEPAVLTFLGTVGSSLAFDDRVIWVNSVLPSGANLWPVYPRDVALVLLIAGLAITVGGEQRWRSVAAGAMAAAAIGVHAQIGVYAVAVLLAFGLWRAWPARALRRWAGDALLLAATALVASAWWWVPRLDTALESGRLELLSFPGLARPARSLGGLVVALGVVGILAIPGVVVAWRRRVRAERFAAVWLLVLAPFGLLGSLAGDLGIITPRRVWFFAAVPLVLCASIATTAWLRRGPMVPVALLVGVAVLVPGVAEVVQTRDLVERVWAPEAADGPLAAAAWAPALAELRQRMRDTGSVSVLAPDNDALHLWEHSGAQPFSFFPSGSVKLGYDLAETTDYGYLERVRLADRAFAAGLPGLCRLAGTTGADAIVLRRDGDLLGTHDAPPAARYRVDPHDRTADAIDRRVGGGLRYLDASTQELLEVAPGRDMALGWSDADVRRVDVYQDRKRPVPPVVLVTGDGRRIPPRTVTSGRGWVLRFPTPDGVPPGSRLVANTKGRARLTRVIGYVPARDLPAPARGVVVLDPATAC